MAAGYNPFDTGTEYGTNPYVFWPADFTPGPEHIAEAIALCFPKTPAHDLKIVPHQCHDGTIEGIRIMSRHDGEPDGFRHEWQTHLDMLNEV